MPVWITYTLLAGCAALLGFSLWAASDRGRERLPRVFRFTTAMQIAAVVLAYLVVRPGAGDDGPSDIAKASAAQQPIFIDLYSNF